MIFHFVLNSLLVFLVLSLSIEFFLFGFKIYDPRIRYICRLLPILKLPFDLLVFEFFGESFFVNLNPFSCEIYLQEFIVKLLPDAIKTDLEASSHFILPKYLASQIPSILLNTLIYSVVIISIIIVSRKIFLFMISRTYLKEVLSTASPCMRAISNLKLADILHQKNIVILTSDKVGIPFAANLHYILFPKNLIEELSQNEFEAVVVHELEHLRWKDPVLKMLCGFICSLFWWLPSSWWLKRLEEEQEQACDAEMDRYGIDILALASAMVKVVKKAKYLKCPFSAICPFDSPKRSHVKRLENLLNSSQSHKRQYTGYSITGVFMCALTFICFWAC
jgi:beta-lactamase regulating signal transducer with metallopeptidase domain